MNVEIVRLDDNGRGIGYIDGKIVFIPKTLPGDIVNVEKTLDKKKYSEGVVTKYIKNSSDKIDSVCPYFNKCGGCQYLNTSYENSVKLKLDIFKNNLSRAGFNQNVVYTESSEIYNYRNKVTLKIVDGKIGFYENLTNDLIEIDYCHLASNIINKYIKEVTKFNIKNGSITIRSNYKNEVMIVINSKNKIDINLINLEDVIGIIQNDNIIYGSMYLNDEINDIKYEITYNSFFQVNPYVTSEIISLIKKNLTKEDIVLDLYCGVGTLGLGVASKVSKVYGIEKHKNAVINAKNNAIINNIENAEFTVGDLAKNIKLKSDINTFLVDPPRSGLDKVVLDKILEHKPNKLIYMSCNPNTLIRDLKLLSEAYDFDYVAAFDMFSHSSHLECLVILKRK